MSNFQYLLVGYAVGCVLASAVTLLFARYHYKQVTSLNEEGKP